MEKETSKYKDTQNRELSWLRFNERVLQEAQDESVPLLERLKFTAIFTGNLDEFFMIRVGSLFDLVSIGNETPDAKSGWTPSEQLLRIYEAVKPLYGQRDAVYREIEQQLRKQGIYELKIKELDPSELKGVRTYFKEMIAPVLSPQIVDANHPFPHLQNKTIHIGAWLKHKSKELFGVVPIPASLPPVLFFSGNTVRYVRMEEIVFEYTENIFNMYAVMEKTKFCITRNADIVPGDECFDDSADFRDNMRRLLSLRKRLGVVRLELSNQVGETFARYLCEKFQIRQEQIFISEVPINLGYVYLLDQKIPAVTLQMLSYLPFTPQSCKELSLSQSLLKRVREHDVLLSYPYESMEPFLKMIREAAFDPSVISVKITIYRLATQAKLVEYLCAAAENGKDVTALIELRARFDEQNNIDWSERLEDAGCRLLYGFEEYKVHSKICLITRREKTGVKYITQIGTGNYNEKTAKLYTDLSLITADSEIGRDANEFFKNMAIGNLQGSYRHLLVAPVGLKGAVLSLMDEEIRKGEEGRILLKMNSVTDIDIIHKLREASCAGVSVIMIIRGICCLLPGVPSQTENITVISVVGRFLEHSRIYCFGTGKEEKIYISSADFMTRNTQRRVEVACPVMDEAAREKIHRILETLLYDTLKARVMQPDGSYLKKSPLQNPIDSQQLLMQDAQISPRKTDLPQNVFRRIWQYMKNLFR